MTEQLLNMLTAADGAEPGRGGESEAAVPAAVEAPAEAEGPDIEETLPAERGDGDDGSLRRHFETLCAEGLRLEEELPGFSLAEALCEPDFLRLTSPLGGVGVRAAWYALHPGDIARDAQRRVISSVRSGSLRPTEGGSGSAAQLRSDPGAMPREAREELKARIRAAAARGEKVYPE